MSEDQLADIKIWRALIYPSELPPEAKWVNADLHTIDWLIGEVERREQEIRDLRAQVSLLAAQQREAFGMADELDQAKAEIERLRGLLKPS